MKQGSEHSAVKTSEHTTTFKSPVRAVCFVFIACVVYLSAQAYLAFPEPSEKPLGVEPESAPELPISTGLPTPSNPFVQYDHPPVPQMVSHDVVRGDTLGSILNAVGVADQDINRLVMCKGECRKLHSLMPGTTLSMRLNDSGGLLSISRPLSDGQHQHFRFLDDEIAVSKTHVERQTLRVYKHVVIRRGESPISAGLRVGGIKEKTILRATQILEYDIDFWRNIHPNDEFEILYEQLYVNDKHVADGAIHALRFKNQGKTYQAFLHSDGLHYESDGSAIQKQFLKAPLKYKRISSNFSNARKHPILGYTRAHRGTDYAAPRGTPVRSTANGVIRAAVRNDRAAGNYLVVDHSNGFQTKYMHLSGFANGVRKGLPVSKGSTIGFVGSTGLSTGPHLHYEVIKNGRHMNPLSVPNPSVESLISDDRADFLATVDHMLLVLESRRNQSLNTESIAIAP